jgi:hypothetical protein
LSTVLVAWRGRRKKEKGGRSGGGETVTCPFIHFPLFSDFGYGFPILISSKTRARV